VVSGYLQIWAAYHYQEICPFLQLQPIPPINNSHFPNSCS
jgi:hypothetical protein